MRAGDELLGTVFNKDHRYVIPIFQRPYVWNEDENWLPLWEDLRKAAEDAEQQSATGDDTDPQEYFLGALVTQHRAPVPRRIPTSMVIDGQQRLTTFQVFLSCARRVATELGATHAAESFTALVRNRVGSGSEHSEDMYKVSTLEPDRAAFEWAARDPGDIRPSPDEKHRLSRAATWFEIAVREWASEAESPSDRLSLLHFAVENRIKVVSIYLDARDDPQVIFEALNHRGVRLDAADLVKNLLFQTLDRQGDKALERELLRDHWELLDGRHWRNEVTTGRVKRVRVDVLLAYWLSAQRGEESSVEHLFEDLKRWMRQTGARAADVIKDIRRYADTMDRLTSLAMTSPVAQAIDRLDATNTTTPWPLILFLHASEGIPEQQAAIGTLALDAFLMRRAVCRLGTKDYNRLFGTVLGVVRDGDRSRAGDMLSDALADQTAESRRWPGDGEFLRGLAAPGLYNDLVRARLRTLLIGLENSLLTSKSEPTTPHRVTGSTFTIEHVMPVGWEQHWGLDDADDERRAERDAHVHMLGNLTLATQGLNSTLSNAAWSSKRQTLQTHSLARLTTGSILAPPPGSADMTQDAWVADWTEDRILGRGRYLAGLAITAWPRPDRSTPTDTGGDPFTSPARPIGGVSPTGQAPVRAFNTVNLSDLIRARTISPNDELRYTAVRSGEQVSGSVTHDGAIITSLGRFLSPSAALRAHLGYEVNGWRTWIHVPTGRSLAELRAAHHG